MRFAANRQTAFYNPLPLLSRDFRGVNTSRQQPTIRCRGNSRYVVELTYSLRPVGGSQGYRPDPRVCCVASAREAAWPASGETPRCGSIAMRRHSV